MSSRTAWNAWTSAPGASVTLSRAPERGKTASKCLQTILTKFGIFCRKNMVHHGMCFATDFGELEVLSRPTSYATMSPEHSAHFARRLRISSRVTTHECGHQTWLYFPHWPGALFNLAKVFLLSSNRPGESASIFGHQDIAAYS